MLFPMAESRKSPLELPWSELFPFLEMVTIAASLGVPLNTLLLFPDVDDEIAEIQQSPNSTKTMLRNSAGQAASAEAKGVG